MFNDFWKLIISKFELSINNLDNLKIEHQKLVLEDIKITEKLEEGMWIRKKSNLKYLQKELQKEIKEKEAIILTLEKIIKKPEILIDVIDNSCTETFNLLKKNNIFLQSILMHIDEIDNNYKEQEHNRCVEKVIIKSNNL